MLAALELVDIDRRAIEAAHDAVGEGKLVVLPTDTVYGIAADAFDPDAVSLLLSAKRRGPDMPVPVLVGSWETIDGLVVSTPAAATMAMTTAATMTPRDPRASLATSRNAAPTSRASGRSP